MRHMHNFTFEKLIVVYLIELRQVISTYSLGSNLSDFFDTYYIFLYWMHFITITSNVNYTFLNKQQHNLYMFCENQTLVQLVLLYQNICNIHYKLLLGFIFNKLPIQFSITIWTIFNIFIYIFSTSCTTISSSNYLIFFN